MGRFILPHHPGEGDAALTIEQNAGSNLGR